MTDTTRTEQVDIEKLLAEFDLDAVLQRTKTTVIDESSPKGLALTALCAEERKLAAEIKAAEDRRKAIRELIKADIHTGDDNLVLMSDDGEPRVLAKMSYPEPTTRVNTEYIKREFPFVEHPEFWVRTESTPRLLVQP